MTGKPCVYILSSKRNGTLYIGVTSDLARRLDQHHDQESGSFVSKYGVYILAWYEYQDDMEHAILREKQLKKWNSAWKLDLIEELNPDWKDLAGDI